MARITKTKAAEILGVSRQTISNYIKEGILGSYVGEHGILYVQQRGYREICSEIQDDCSKREDD